MRRLWVQLTLAFGLVVLLAMGATGLLINQTTGAEFRQYITRSDIQAAGSGAQALMDYYVENGSWQGVDALLSGGVWMGPGVSSAPDFATGGGRAGPGTEVDVLLADSRGIVVYDSTAQAVGKRLSGRDKQGASAITLPGDGSVIGYLLLSVSGPADRLGALEEVFLYRVRRILYIGGALAVCLVVLVGALLSRSLTSPLQRLAQAAREVAKGHLGQKVKVEGSPEVAEVGRAFNEMTAALQEAEVQRKSLVADVAHELRTPLTVLQGNLRAILDGVYSLEQGEIARLYDETLLLGRLVEDLRELALADAGQLRLEPRPIAVAPIVEDTIDKMAMAAQDREVFMTAEVPQGLPPILADPDRVAQVLRNLLLNAVQHTPSGGCVTVSVCILEQALEVSVVDTGVGIAPDHLPHVFERFWRADPSRARGGRSAGGSGIGLAVAQSLIEAQGGHISVESEPEKGASFRFTLPLA